MIGLKGFQKGYVPWNKGKKASPETKKRMSLSLKKVWTEEKRKICSEKSKEIGIGKWMTGKKHTDETKRKISESHKGAKSYLWKGGITPFNHAQRVLFKNTMQKQIFERDDYTCQLCGVKGVDLQVDHIQSWAEYIDLRFSMDNCRTLCASCHYEITFGKPMPKSIKTWGQTLRQKEGIVT